MRDLLRFRIELIFIFIFLVNNSFSQLISDTHVSKNYTLKSATINNGYKVIRVNIHFIMRSNGTGNFSETKNVLGNQTNENGYWFADQIVNYANNYLDDNIAMTQQLSYSKIPVEDINYSYKLNGVFFHRSDSDYESYGIPYSCYTINNGNAINAILYVENDGHGAAGSTSCWIGGIGNAYESYLDESNSWYIKNKTKVLNHEIGHILSLDHPKRSGTGDPCIIGGVQYYDNCDDTPTFMDLINDGYTDPYEWCDGEYSNNIMDYSCNQRAFTPDQINKVHSYIENVFTNYQYGTYSDTEVQITSFSNNMAYIAEKVVIPSGASIVIPNNDRLYIDALEFDVNGAFEVPLGSEFEFVPYGL